MIRVKINQEDYTIDSQGTISTGDRKSINPIEWRAVSLMVDLGSGLKSISLAQAEQAVNHKTYLRSEANCQPKLLEIESLTIISDEE